MATLSKSASAKTIAPGKKPLQQSSPHPWQTFVKTILWTSFWLFLLDTGINLLVPFPPTAEQSPTKLQQYFEYGRSIEGKLERMVGQDLESSDPIIASGWLDPQSWEALPNTVADSNHRLIAIYGMSFSNDIGMALATLDDTITLRSIGGPAAPPSHSFAAFSADTESRSAADVVVMGVLASSVKRMGSISGINWSYEHPAPYTYPHYTLDSTQSLVATEPAIQNADEFITAFQQKGEQWQTLKRQMQQYDRPFSPVVFDHNFSDRSAIFRLIRRGWANRARNNSKTNLFDPRTGFDPNAAEIQTLKALLSEFVSTVNAAEQQPIILLVNDQGYGDSLHTLLEPWLSQLEVSVLSTHTFADANNAQNFVSDGHFTPEVNLKIGQALHDLMQPPSNHTP